MDKDKMQDIYDMKLHEQLEIDNGINTLRVPGGWLYMNYNSSTTFVPWHDSGRLIEQGNYEELKAKLKKAEDALKEVDFELTDDEITPHEALIMLTNIALITDKYNG